MRFTLGLLLAIGGFSPLGVSAEALDPPLSVIDWLDAPQPRGNLPHARDTQSTAREPAVAQSGTAPPVTTRPLADGEPARIGIVPAAVTGMQPDLWLGSDVNDLADLIRDLPAGELPATNALLFTLLLTDADAPPRDADALTRARAKKLMALGAVDPALSLIEAADGDKRQALFDLWADLALLVGTEDKVCDTLSQSPWLSNDIGLDIFCDAREGDWADAALSFGSAKALQLLPDEMLAVLDRFLNPDMFEDARPLPVPRDISPLAFRLYETIGEPLPTRTLPRAYAVADLRDIAGWKSQLEAAERLTRAGALSDNRLLGFYTDRKAAASGGIWDRVRAIQRLDTALAEGAEAVQEALPPAWYAMHDAGLAVSLSNLFYSQLSEIPLEGTAADVKARMGLLSSAYEEVARDLPVGVPGANAALVTAVAQGEAAHNTPSDALPRAIHDAFANPQPDAQIMSLSRSGRLGEALLLTLAELDAGSQGDSRALRPALATLRALGLESTARQASLQLLLGDSE